MILVANQTSKSWQKACKIAEYNDFQLIAYDQKNYKDGTREYSFKQRHIEEGIILFFEFELPFMNHAFDLIVLIKFFKQFGLKALLIPFMPFLREHSDSHSASNFSMFREILGNLKIITIDAHIKTDNIISLQPEFFKGRILDSDLLIFPDFGAQRYQHFLKNDSISGIKSRVDGVTKIDFSDFAKIANRDCIILDDIYDTGKTVQESCHQLKKYGAKSVKAYITHMLDTNFKGLDYLYFSDTVLENGSACDYTEAFRSLKNELK